MVFLLSLAFLLLVWSLLLQVFLLFSGALLGHATCGCWNPWRLAFSGNTAVFCDLLLLESLVLQALFHMLLAFLLLLESLPLLKFLLLLDPQGC
jgi:hypothetical protein